MTRRRNSSGRADMLLLGSTAGKLLSVTGLSFLLEIDQLTSGPVQVLGFGVTVVLADPSGPVQGCPAAWVAPDAFQVVFERCALIAHLRTSFSRAERATVPPM